MLLTRIAKLKTSKIASVLGLNSSVKFSQIVTPLRSQLSKHSNSENDSSEYDYDSNLNVSHSNSSHDEFAQQDPVELMIKNDDNHSMFVYNSKDETPVQNYLDTEQTISNDM